MKIVDTDKPISTDLTYWAYNGLDCCLTLEILENMPFPAYAQPTYDFERKLQGPALEMMLRGFPVDRELMAVLAVKIMQQRDKLKAIGYLYGDAITGKPLNIGSVQQLCKLFYDYLKLPPIYETDKKTKKKHLSVNRKAMEKIYNYHYAKPLANVVMKFRDLDKQKDFLTCKVDNDSRIRTSYNPSATETGRWSSSSNAFGGGTNLQNIEPALRVVLSASPGRKLGYIDFEQAESRVVGLLAYTVTGKGKYLDACESGDLHTSVAKLIWPKLPWTGDIKRDRKIAEQPYYRHFSYRDIAKRGGHASNYGGKAPAVAREIHVDTHVMEEFQQLYFGEFPEIRQWHTWTGAQLQTLGYLDTPFNRRRYFLGRRGDDSTFKEALAHVPQSTIADLTNEGLFRVWQSQICEVIHQNHDAIVIMYPEEKEDEVIPAVKKLMEIPIQAKDRTVVIPTDAEVGWNWAKIDDPGLKKLGILENPDGMMRYRGHDKRRRSETPMHSKCIL